jgi:SAM-dependent methyltransferase
MRVEQGQFMMTISIDAHRMSSVRQRSGTASFHAAANACLQQLQDKRGIMSNGWDESASAWIADMGEEGDFSRQFILDPAMLARIDPSRYRNALDVGCGEGRFCRKLRERGIAATGIDPTAALLRRARSLDRTSRYVDGRAEDLPFPNEIFDLVVSYLTFIDIEDGDAAIAEMARVLAPGGSLLIANLSSFATANGGKCWTSGDDRRIPHFSFDNYHEERADWVSWRGIKIQNFHRPMTYYMTALIGAGLELVHFDEPQPVGGDPDRAAWFRQVPYFVLMEWRKPHMGTAQRNDPPRPSH